MRRYTDGTATCAPNKVPAAPGATPQGPMSGTCAGTIDMVSGVLDYRPVKRVDIYGGVAWSHVQGGLANGFQKHTDLAETVGIRFAW